MRLLVTSNGWIKNPCHEIPANTRSKTDIGIWEQSSRTWRLRLCGRYHWNSSIMKNADLKVCIVVQKAIIEVLYIEVGVGIMKWSIFLRRSDLDALFIRWHIIAESWQPSSEQHLGNYFIGIPEIAINHTISNFVWKVDAKSIPRV